MGQLLIPLHMLLWKVFYILNKKLTFYLNLPMTPISLYHRIQILLHLRNLIT